MRNWRCVEDVDNRREIKACRVPERRIYMEHKRRLVREPSVGGGRQVGETHWSLCCYSLASSCHIHGGQQRRVAGFLGMELAPAIGWLAVMVTGRYQSANSSSAGDMMCVSRVTVLDILLDSSCRDNPISSRMAMKTALDVEQDECWKMAGSDSNIGASFSTEATIHRRGDGVFRTRACSEDCLVCFRTEKHD